MYGTVMDDTESEDAFFKFFDDMFSGGGSGNDFDMFNDIDTFEEFLGGDEHMFKQFF